MTPTKQGKYEFSGDALVEIRKGLGITQTKMAEMLDVPPNTLSRWETGVTVPDAESLASIYSLAKEKGISPIFFNLRRIPLNVTAGSTSTNPIVDPLSCFEALHAYLTTQIEILGVESEPTIKIQITNSAPEESKKPRVVFTGVGLSIAITGSDGASIYRPSSPKVRIKRIPETFKDHTPSSVETPWQNDSKRRGLLNKTFTRTDKVIFPDITPRESEYGEVLFPGQSLIYELDIDPMSLPYLEFKTEGTISRRYLFHYQDTFTMPEEVIKPVVVNALRDLNSIDLYGILHSLLSSMPKFNTETRLVEVQTFAQSFPTAVAKLKATQEDLQKLWYLHKLSIFRAQIRASFIFLGEIITRLDSMKKAIESNVTDRVSADTSSLLALKALATKLDSETQDLMKSYNITSEEVDHKPLPWNDSIV
ncbi:helix-turn-helix transcriptional regulator [Dehalogenimonas sp. 4OHTPN]|uniref:Helix-turn-helix transcriptional regulator n=1 Tax=Dehalogenimonas sp. 4OHTPN TaxID=3166643 RepID=A0AAU8GB17_9CHLR